MVTKMEIVFDVQVFGETFVMVIPIVIFLSIFVCAFLGALARHTSNGNQLVVLFYKVFCVGVVVHELAHYSMSKLFGVKVKEARWFSIESKRIEGREAINISGFVRTEEIYSVVTSLVLGIAPLLVNGTLIALIYYYGPIWTEISYWNVVITYAGVAFALGTRPSNEDLTLWWKILKKNPRRGFFEFIELILFGVVLYYLVFYQIEAWIILTTAITFFILLIVQARKKSGSQDVVKKWTYKD